MRYTCTITLRLDTGTWKHSGMRLLLCEIYMHYNIKTGYRDVEASRYEGIAM